MTEPDIERIKEWVKDLYYGDGLQGNGYLTVVRGGKEYDCCLGRACKVMGIERMEIHNLTSSSTRPQQHYRYGTKAGDMESSVGLLPSSVKDWYGLGNHDPVILILPLSWGCLRATEANDGIGWDASRIRTESGIRPDDQPLTFSQIADCLTWEYLKGEKPLP